MIRIFAFIVFFAFCLFSPLFFLNLENNVDIAGRGCCSHHGGVCGCQSGRAVCCDGSYSPSCSCHHDDVINLANM